MANTKVKLDFFRDGHNEIGNSVGHSLPRSLCDACLESNDPASETGIPSAEMFCKDCCLKLCESCLKIHRKSKLTVSHKLETMKSQTIRGQNQTKVVLEVCEEHESECLRIYCSWCKTVVCSFCYIESHQGHKWSDVEKAAEEFCNEIQDHIQSLAVGNKSLQVKKEEVNQAKLNVTERMKSLELKIQERKTLLKETIDRHANQLLIQVEALHQEKHKLLKTEEEDIDVQMASHERYFLDCKNFTTLGSAGEICRNESQLRKRASELLTMKESICQRHLEPVNVGLKISKLDEFLKENGANFVGMIEDIESTLAAKLPVIPSTDQVSLTLAGTDDDLSESALKSLNQKDKNEFLGNTKDTVAASNSSKCEVVLTKTQCITGMSVVKNELFITTENCSKIEVYDSLTFVSRRHWSLRGLTSPKDMVACMKFKCLYIFDAIGYGKIYQTDINGLKMLSWNIGSTRVRLSVSPESNVVVTYLEKAMLREYEPAEKVGFIQELYLKWNFAHAVKLKTGNFVVSRVQSVGGVFEVDEYGQDMNCFKDKRFKQLNGPEQVAVDKHGSVIVVDRGNKRVLLLNSYLEFQRELLSSKNGLYDPIAMVLDEANTRRRLLVTDYVSDQNLWRIFVINIPYL